MSQIIEDWVVLCFLLTFSLFFLLLFCLRREIMQKVLPTSGSDLIYVVEIDLLWRMKINKCCLNMVMEEKQ